MKSVLRKKTKRTGLRPEKNGPDLAEVVFESEIEMARRRDSKIRNFTLNPDFRKSLLQKVLDLLGEFSDGQDVTERKFPINNHGAPGNRLPPRNRGEDLINFFHYNK